MLDKGKIKTKWRKINKILAMGCTVVMIVLMWLGWVGKAPIYFGVFIYMTFIGIYHVFSLAVHGNDAVELRDAMKSDKKNFLSFVNRRFFTKIAIVLFEAIDDIHIYSKKNAVSDNDTEIKDTLDALKKTKAILFREGGEK